MKVNKNNNMMKEMMSVTCPNCGTEITLHASDNSEHNNECCMCVDGYGSGIGCCAKSPVELKISQLEELLGSIKDDGYLSVDGIVRRWLPAQCLRMISSKEGFHASLMQRSVDYAWKVMKNELHAQRIMRLDNDDEYETRTMFLNPSVAHKMAEDYINELIEYLRDLNTYHAKSAQTNLVRLGFKTLTNTRSPRHSFANLHVILSDMADSIQHNTHSPSKAYVAFCNFESVRREINRLIKFKESKMCQDFVNAYKAAGAYYTMRHLVLYEGFVHPESMACTNAITMYDLQKNALKLIDLHAREIARSLDGRRGASVYGYKLLGELKEMLDYNNFDYNKTVENWGKLKELRNKLREERKANRRPRK